MPALNLRLFARAGIIGGVAAGLVGGAVLVSNTADGDTPNTASTAHSAPLAKTFESPKPADIQVPAPVETIPGWVALSAPDTITAGSDITLNAIAGNKGEPAAEDTVYLHYWNGQDWAYYADAKTDDTGRTNFTVKADSTLKFRAVIANEETGDYEGVSGEENIEVTPAPAQETATTQAPSTSARTYNVDTSNGIVAAAASLAGAPYVFGAAGPNAFDCSGLVKYVYAQFGVSLPHGATDQGHAGYSVSQADAQPGDLILFGDGSYYYHVGIYAGDGKIWHAPQSGDVVRLQTIWTSDYHVTRIL
ncbi:MAG: C40 family peptidase [Corynebacteriales bacterium]|nr:C40 family peptidase [Mycobacteriales bacterium]